MRTSSSLALLSPSLLLLVAAVGGCTAAPATADDTAHGAVTPPTQSTSAALMRSDGPFRVALQSATLAVAASEFMGSPFASVSEDVREGDSPAGTVVWGGARTGHFVTVCAPSRLPGVDDSILDGASYEAGVTTATFNLTLELTDAAKATPDVTVLTMTPGYYRYDEFGELEWIAESLVQPVTAKEINSGVAAEYAYSRGEAFRRLNRLPPGCGIRSCEDQAPLPRQIFADDKTCVQIEAVPQADGTSPLTSARATSATIGYKAQGFEPNFPRTMTLTYGPDPSAGDGRYGVTPVYINMGETNPGPSDAGEEFEYRIVRKSAGLAPNGTALGGPPGSYVFGWITKKNGYYDSDGQFHGPPWPINFNFDDAAEVASGKFIPDTGSTGPIVSINGISIGAYGRNAALGSSSFTMELESAEPTTATVDRWAADARRIPGDLDVASANYLSVKELASWINFYASQNQLTLASIEALLVFNAQTIAPTANVADLYDDGFAMTKPKTDANLPTWFIDAGKPDKNPRNFAQFQRLKGIRAQLLTNRNGTKVLEKAHADVAAARQRLEDKLAEAEHLLGKLVRWNRVFRDELTKLGKYLKESKPQFFRDRDKLLMVSRASKKLSLDLN